MARVMYFESLRSSDDGMLAVGTVVMNRLHSGKYPHTVCGVVGQPNQFAPGALDLPMTGPGRARAEHMAAAVLAGARHPGVGNAMFFHTAERQYYRNDVRYVAYAGGNAFYEKTPMGYPYSMAQGFRPQRPTRSFAFQPQPEPQQMADADRLTLFLTTGRGLY